MSENIAVQNKTIKWYFPAAINQLRKSSGQIKRNVFGKQRHLKKKPSFSSIFRKTSKKRTPSQILQASVSMFKFVTVPAFVCKAASEHTTRPAPCFMTKPKRSISAQAPPTNCQHGGGGLMIWACFEQNQLRLYFISFKTWLGPDDFL